MLSEFLYYFTIKLPNIVIGKIKGNLIHVHWDRGLNNFGDCLAPVILKHYGFTPVYSQLKDSDIILTGTILQLVPKQYCGIIFGTGADDVKLDFPNANILGLRGHLTLKNLQFSPQHIILGDPGLIMNLVFPQHIRRRFELGIVPHFVDKYHCIVNEWKARFGKDCVVIDIQQKPRKVIRQIKSCKFIISSSLHGLIISDAFNIPNARFVIRETMPTHFFDYKFDDYYSSLNIKTITLEAKGDETLDNILKKMRLHTDQVTQLQNNLDRTFKQLRQHFNK